MNISEADAVVHVLQALDDLLGRHDLTVDTATADKAAWLLGRTHKALHAGPTSLQRITHGRRTTPQSTPTTP